MRIVGLFLSLVSLAALAEPFRFTVLHTNDLHSHVEGNGPDGLFTAVAGDGDPVKGHYARLVSLIKKVRKEKAATAEGVLVVDAGDSFSGSLFQALAPVPSIPLAPELEYFHLAGYDAFTPGNHELDAGEVGYANAIDKAKALGFLDGIVATNWRARRTAAPALQAIPKVLVREVRSGNRSLRVGILGFMGPGAAQDCAPNRPGVSFVGYDDSTGKGRVKEIVRLAEQSAVELRRSRRVDLVVALLHGGMPEDLQLAAAKGVDLVIAGHSHDLYETPKRVGAKLVAQAGSYGKYLGNLELEWNEGKLSLRNPGRTYFTIDDKVEADAEMTAKVQHYRAALDRLLAPNGYRYDTPVATVVKDMVHTDQPHDALGLFVTSRIESELRRRLADPPDVFFEELTLIREDWLTVKGAPAPQQFSDIFRLLPVGFGPNFSIGSPVVSFYVTGSELKRLVDGMELQRKIGRRGSLGYSDTFNYRVRSWGIPFVNRIADLKLHGKEMKDWPALVHLSTSAYVASFIPRMKEMSHGLVSVVMKDKSGQPIEKPFVLPVPSEPFLFAESFKH